MSKIILITGASRGIGLELVNQLLSNTKNLVIACARNPFESPLAKIENKNLTLVKLDVNSPDSIQTAAKSVGEKYPGGIDVLINNAGINLSIDANKIPLSLMQSTAKEMMDTYQTNVVGPLLVTQQFMPLLRKSTSKIVINISSVLGSIEATKNVTGYLGYRASKCSLNMLNQAFAHDFAKEDFVFITVHPGWLKTDMGGHKASTPVDVGVKGIIKIMEEAKKEDNGTYKVFDGTTLPW